MTVRGSLWEDRRKCDCARESVHGETGESVTGGGGG